METKRVKLVPKTLEEVRSMLDGMSEPDRSTVSPDWLARVAAAREADPWLHGFNVVLEEGDLAVGHAGFPGPPGEDGVVEIAYGIDPAHQGWGYATQAARALANYAFGDDRVRRVIAHTLEEEGASPRVLAKNGFRNTGRVNHPEDGWVWRWEKSRSAGV